MTVDETVTDTSTDPDEDREDEKNPAPALLVAYRPQDSIPVDHFLLTSPSPFSIGRRTEHNDLASDDLKISKYHAKITRDHGEFVIEDEGSTNGTYVNGEKITGAIPLSDAAVIRVGQTLLVFHFDARPMLSPLRSDRFGIAGQFHVMPLLKDLEEAALSERHVLLAGYTGSGKELAANALAELLKRKPFVVHNAARYTSEEEIESTLFGISRRTFSNVDERPGLIERANRGVLFLDEVHNLPQRIQKSLLRVIEDKKYSRIGETKTRNADVRFIFASNKESPSYGLAHDFLARLRITNIPPLSNRIADIPSIFEHLLVASLKKKKLDTKNVLRSLRPRQYEALMLYGFPENNVRGLSDLVDRIVTRIQTDIESRTAIREVFSERFPNKAKEHAHSTTGFASSYENKIVNKRSTRPDTDEIIDIGIEASSTSSVRSRYEQNKDLILKVYNECGCVINTTCRVLKGMDIKVSPRWLSVFLDKWGVRLQKKRDD
ncbi:MAG: FHA domain-containing protein [Proteobacteria bacterium]|nr:FHA domain-containing protein [Pseudomonadota bacterium]